MRRAAASLIAATIVFVSGCSDGGSPPEPVVTCNDGYVAHPSYSRDRHGCGSHGGAANLSMDALDAYLEDFPLDSPIAYLCHDGWRSTAIGQQGACSSHGGIVRTVHADGTQFIVDGADRGTIIKPDGSTVAPFDPSTGP